MPQRNECVRWHPAVAEEDGRRGAHAARATGQPRHETPTGGLFDHSMSYPARCCLPALALAAW